MRNPAINRRTMLRSIGAATIGLPLLEEMMTSKAFGAEPAQVPVRAFNVFFGLGIPAPLQTEGFEGVLEPLQSLSDKLLIMRNVDQIRCDEKGSNAHYDGASGAFTATPPDGEARAGGASIDQVIRRAHYPQGLPQGMVPTLLAGTFFRRSRVGRYVHSYNKDGTVAATIQEKPRDLFERVFGAVSDGGGDQDVRARLRHSVLDSVVQDFQFYTGPNSPLGAASKARVIDHLDRIREFEQRAFSLKKLGPNVPLLPPQSQIPHGGPADPGGEGIDMNIDDLSTEWRLQADLYALAVKMDRARFGALTFLAAGERLRLRGDYQYNGRAVYAFNDERELGKSGSGGCSHEWWHQFNEKKQNEQLRAHAHMKMREIAYFLHRLDEEDCMEANGRTILENSLITISTESGDGRHNDVKRELSGVFHAITGANGRFKTGQIMDVGAEGIDVYNTMLSAFDTQDRIGPNDREGKEIDSIRA
ncbi:DUF1552 domain-containing protein [Aureliella helgolandensis]|uniref:DUF1552 domain-containing protein n=1 Tax=Aureliella helgolandensis TaxID=2527968 RepID=A0A518G0F1_9BACT|nr:DUF1552 domain-containing protein [Aureliella helgolandensis]QDV22071.1 hypothetical protein Q31a_03500 [Aureliella helgolandensis]